jgi:hypothetical protein
MSVIVEVAGPIGRRTEARHFTHEPYSYQASSELLTHAPRGASP